MKNSWKTTLKSIKLIEGNFFFHRLLKRLVDSARVQNNAYGQHMKHFILHFVQHVIFVLRILVENSFSASFDVKKYLFDKILIDTNFISIIVESRVGTGTGSGS